jgi:hypothetical protein
MDTGRTIKEIYPKYNTQFLAFNSDIIESQFLKICSLCNTSQIDSTSIGDNL